MGNNRSSSSSSSSSSKQVLQVGDHIFVCRAAGYSHHGIYVGEVRGVKYVIHFTSTANKSSVSSNSTAEKWGCLVCGFKANLQLGVVKTCLDCFLSGDSLNVKRYRNSKSCDEVVNTAFQLLQHGFGNYDLVANNCEHFATLCKTGKHHSDQVEQVLLHPIPFSPTPTIFELPRLIDKLVKGELL